MGVADVTGVGYQDPDLLDSMILLFSGNGNVLWYSVWVAIVLLGLLRWLCDLDRSDYDVRWPESTSSWGLRRPLLGDEERPAEAPRADAPGTPGQAPRADASGQVT